MLSGDAFGCAFRVNTSLAATNAQESSYADPSTFGVLACGSSSKQDSVSAVVFWDIYETEGLTKVLATACTPQAVSYRGDVLYNASDSMLLGIGKLGELDAQDLVGISSNVSKGQLASWSGPLNNTALNG